MSAIDRIIEYIEYKNVATSLFEKQVGLTNGYIAKTAKRNSGVGEEILQKIIDKCPELSPMWLLLGNGEMLNTGESTSIVGSHNSGVALQNVNAKKIIRVGVDSSKKTNTAATNEKIDVEILLSEISELKQKNALLEKSLEEKDKTIEMLREMVIQIKK